MSRYDARAIQQAKLALDGEVRRRLAGLATWQRRYASWHEKIVACSSKAVKKREHAERRAEAAAEAIRISLEWLKAVGIEPHTAMTEEEARAVLAEGWK